MNELDVVRLKDGREGTVIYLDKQKEKLIVEFAKESANDYYDEEFALDDVEQVVWQAPSNM